MTIWGKIFAATKISADIASTVAVIAVGYWVVKKLSKTPETSVRSIDHQGRAKTEMPKLSSASFSAE